MSAPHYFSYTKTGRYYLSGSLKGDYDTVCFALHGYGQLASYFVRHFNAEKLSRILFVVPEAPHRFYLSGSNGRVGASWMTKEDRLKDIADYCAYLDELYRLFLPQITEAGKVGVLGFSQGVATACRWLTQSNYHFDFLVNYAGVFPPDLDPTTSLQKMIKMPVWMVIGNEDEYISVVEFKKNVAAWRNLGYPLQSKIFEGKHKIYAPVLETVISDL